MKQHLAITIALFLRLLALAVIRDLQVARFDAGAFVNPQVVLVAVDVQVFDVQTDPFSALGTEDPRTVQIRRVALVPFFVESRVREDASLSAEVSLASASGLNLGLGHFTVVAEVTSLAGADVPACCPQVTRASVLAWIGVTWISDFATLPDELFGTLTRWFGAAVDAFPSIFTF